MCCGRPSQPVSTGGQRVTRPAASPQPVTKAAPPPRAALALPAPVFEYVGETALTLVSPVTRKTYRFEQTGARLAVDVRDRSWITFVPKLVAAS